MKKRKILSLVLTMMMFVSVMPSVISAESTNVIWEEDFSGDLTGYAVSNGSIVDEVFKAGTGAGNGGFNFDTLNAEVSDAPEGKVRVKFDIKAAGGASTAPVTKVELKTNAEETVKLINYGAYNQIFATTDIYGTKYTDANFAGDKWYTNDIILDFENKKLIINVSERDSGTALVTNYEHGYDLSAVTTIKGIDVFGWNNAGDTYYDNFLIEYYETPTVVEPVEPEFNPIIWEEDFSGELTGYNVTNGSIVDEVFKAGTGAGNGGLNFDTLNAAVSDAPEGKVRVKWDMKVNSQAGSVAKVELKTDADNVFLINYGQYNELRPDGAAGSYTPVAVFESNVWYTNDIVLDFTNNKLIMNVAERDGNAAKMTDFEYTCDLSAVHTIKGIDVFGWGCAGDTYYDNFSIKYYIASEDEPEEPEIQTSIFSENFDDKTTADLSGYVLNGTTAIENNVFVVKKTSSDAGGFVTPAMNIPVDGGTRGNVRIKFDAKTPTGSTAMTKAELVTNGSNVPLIAFRQENMIGQAQSVNVIDGVTYEYAWYNCDIVLDFINNKIIVNVVNKDKETILLKDVEWECNDLSAVTTIKGLDFYTWGSMDETCFDNVSMEYTVEDPEVTSDSISIYTDDNKENIASVNPGANKIIINFGTPMAADSVENAVVLTNVTDETDVTYTGTLSGTQYVMVLDTALAANKTYKLLVSADVENIFGVALGAEYVLNFVTNNGSFEAALLSLKQNSAEVADFAGLTTGEATVELSFEKTNPDAKTIKLVYAFYNGNKAENIIVHDVSIGAEEKSGTKTDTVTIGSLENITGVSVMLWENLENIAPLCESVDL